MKRVFVALLLLMGVAATASLAFAYDDFNGTVEGPRASMAGRADLRSRASKLHGTAVYGDTTYVGFTPGHYSATANPWSIFSGFSPAGTTGAGQVVFHRPGFASNPEGGTWDFDTPVNGDTLQGWWPYRTPFTTNAPANVPDWKRPWFGIDNGNQANYVLTAANGPSKRTTGVVGVWHADFGNNVPENADGGAAVGLGGVSANGATWAPISGNRSAWMGLRRENDNQVKDPITGNPFNETIIKFNGFNAVSTSGNDKDFPGYGSQMDQMLYRDISVPVADQGANLTLRFRYRLKMSTGFGTATGTRVGWFDKDPLGVVTGTSNLQTGNFISSSDAANNAPRDSFMVYIGAGAEGTFKTFGGSTVSIFDPQRRWFDEVVRANEAANLYKEILSVSGLSVPTTLVDYSGAAAVPNSVIAPILAANSGKIRVVFRVKTNRGFDDEGTAYSSAGAGAVQLDDVTYSIGASSSPAGWGTFESGGDPIDNSTGVTAVNAWKSTGKPPSSFGHVRQLSDLIAANIYHDLCGVPGSFTRVENMNFGVISFGNFDAGEAVGSLTAGTINVQLNQQIMSPTIQLCGNPAVPGPVWPNNIGLKNPAAGEATGNSNSFATEDYNIDSDVNYGQLNLVDGVLWRYMIMCYPAKSTNPLTPATQSDGYNAWGQYRTAPFIFFNGDQVTFRERANPTRIYSMFKWSSSASQDPSFPDSVIIGIGIVEQCLRFGSTTCGAANGAYFDEISLDIVDGDPQPISASIWDLYQDAFPENETDALVAYGESFDTTAAVIKSGLNISANVDGAFGPYHRFTVPGDSVAVSAPGNSVRMDLVFRILPGPGNYVTIGRPDLGTLRKVPSSATPIAGPVANSSNFWESYLANNGPNGTAPHTPRASWDPNVWNSARCDTSEANIFAYQSRGILGGPGDSGVWQTTYHEQEMNVSSVPADPYATVNLRTALGVSRHRCFVASAGAATTTVDCVHNPSGTDATGASWDLTYVPASAGSGWDGTATTTEGTKIIPDGLLTAGAHVEYFFRKEDGLVFKGLMPDTTTIYGQPGEGPSFDAHRWQEISILPDRWKDTGYKHPVQLTFGVNPACALVVDQNDRRGDETVWVGVADTIGATTSDKYGAGNGWHAAGGQEIGQTVGANPDPATFIAAHRGQHGTTWDFYQTKASESSSTNAGSIGNRAGFKDPSNPQADNHRGLIGPTPKMMNTFYKTLILLFGDLNSGDFGPFQNKSQNDFKFVEDWLAQGNGTSADRAIWASGNGFVEDNWNDNNGSSVTPGNGPEFNDLYLGVDLRSSNYIAISGNNEFTPDITRPAASPMTAGDIWGLESRCTYTNDVLTESADLVSLMTPVADYEAALGAPTRASFAKAFDGAGGSPTPWIAVTDGFDLFNLVEVHGTSDVGRSRYVKELLSNVLGSVCTVAGTPVISLDVPNTRDGGEFVNFLNLNNNPYRSGRAKIHFGLAKADRVEITIFDVAGRQVKKFAETPFTAGEHDVLWDGSDDAGKPVARGVFFTQVKYRNSNFAAAKKLTVLR